MPTSAAILPPLVKATSLREGPFVFSTEYSMMCVASPALLKVAVDDLPFQLKQEGINLSLLPTGQKEIVGILNARAN